ncbi:HAMP domain-containing histidine kinase [candidate division WOR-3 bacterium]|nr:HAMP domain-containing histidine kinase [candidate division WOR-3 bacterium]
MDLEKIECVEIIEKIETGFILIDAEKRKTLFVNNFALNILQTSSCDEILEILGISGKNLLWPEKRQREIRYGEKTLGYSIYSTPKGNAAILVNDITEKERLQKIAEASATMDNIGYIFSGFSHEVGNPLNSIKTMASVLRENIQNFPEKKTLEYLESVLTEINRIEYLLRMFKVFNAHEDIKMKTFSLRSFFEKFSKLIITDMTKRRIGFSIKYTEPFIFAKADERALQQVLLNVITNAMDAVEGSQDPKIEIEVSLSESGVFLKITDNGIGISEDLSEKIFFPFYTIKPKGTGMGLTIVKNLLFKMGGSIQIRSGKKGTEALIQLTEGE